MTTPTRHHATRMLTRGLLLMLAVAGLPGVHAATPATGATLPDLAFTDQFDTSHRLADCQRLILFAPDRDSSELVSAALADVDAGLLQRGELCYVADISAMPSLVTTMFALPAMRDYGYPVMLGREPAATEALPRRAGQVTLIGIVDGRIAQVDHAADSETLNAAIAKTFPSTTPR